MAKEDTTHIKTELTKIKTGMSDADVTRLKNNQSGSSDTETYHAEGLLGKTVSSASTIIGSNPQTLVNTHLQNHQSTNRTVNLQDQRIAQQYPNHRVLKQRFVLTETLGSGGMGNVYLAKDLLREEMEDSTPHVAIKVLNDDCRELPGALQALQSEAKKAQVLSHPNIVTVYDFDRDGETAFITMEYIAGEALKTLMRKSKMPQVKALMVIDRVARGLAYAHQQGFVHADIKPANIFCADNGAVKILDFGIAKAFTAATMETRSLGDKLTEGALTPAYASLEMLERQPPHPSDDVYSLACMAYELLNGRHPFIDAAGHTVSADVAKEQGLKPKVIKGVSRRQMNAIRKGLAFDRSQRFKDAGAFIDAIKPRTYKKEIALFIIAASITGVIMFSGSQALDKVVPSVDSLKPELLEVANTIKEADSFIETEDIDFAHRLYSQAWELASDITKTDLDERDKARSILSDRMTKISNILISKLQNKELDEFQLRELLVALEFMLQDDLYGNKDKIKQAIQKINSNLNKKEG